MLCIRLTVMCMWTWPHTSASILQHTSKSHISKSDKTDVYLREIMNSFFFLSGFVFDLEQSKSTCYSCFLSVVDSTVVSWMGASPLCKEGSGLHAAPSSGSHVGGTACGRRDGCVSGTRGRLQHPFWRLHLCQDCPQVSSLLFWSMAETQSLVL